MKKYLMSAAVVAAALVNTEAQAKDVRDFGGFYIGGNLGYGFGNTTALTGGVGDDAVFQSQKNNLSVKGIKGGLHVGYGWMVQRLFYVGVEAYGKLSNMEGNQQAYPGQAGALAVAAANSTWKAKHTNSFGAALRLGGVINSMLTYVKVGIESAAWKFEQAHSRGVFGATPETNLVTDSKSRRLTGIPFGIGMEAKLTERLTFGGELTYTHYTGSANVTTNYNSQQVNARFSPNTMDFSLRLSCKL